MRPSNPDQTRIESEIVTVADMRLAYDELKRKTFLEANNNKFYWQAWGFLVDGLAVG